MRVGCACAALGVAVAGPETIMDAAGGGGDGCACAGREGGGVGCAVPCTLAGTEMVVNAGGGDDTGGEGGGLGPPEGTDRKGRTELKIPPCVGRGLPLVADASNRRVKNLVL